jgi:hypothetical protein
MALRFRFPWGSLLTAAGYAIIAVALAYALLTDFHGHLQLRALLNGAGAAGLGLLAWRYSERLTDFVNLHTAPVLRLGVSGGVAMWLATRWSGVFSELAAGTAKWWLDAAVSIAFFLCAMPAVLALVTLLTLIETAFAARRGGAAVMDATRPILRHALISIAAAGALAYLVVMLPHAPEQLALQLVPDERRTSGWVRREQRLFSEVARGWRCEVLVVPPDAPAGSLDRPARSLIGRYLAAELAARSGLCVADPTLVARAVGTRARAYGARRVEALADAMGAVVLVRGEVRMEPQRPAFALALRVARRAGPSAAWSAGEEAVWGPLVFSDELPPEAAFALVAAEAADSLGLELEPAAAASAESADVAPQLSLSGLAAAGTPEANARSLQLLAATYHPSDVGGEHLWERSLVALAGLPAADERARVLRARAALHLQRRPHALALLDGLGAAEARALRALTDGNAGTAEAHTREVTDPAARLTLRLELEALRGYYGRSAGAPARRKEAMDSHPGLAALLYVPFSGGLPQQWEPLLAAQLQQAGGDPPPPVLAGALAPVARALAQAAGLDSAGDDIERGYAPVWRARAARWRTQQAYDRVAEWDTFEALHAANRAAVLLQARAAMAGEAGEGRSAIAGGFSGHPGLLAVLATALARGTGDEQPPLLDVERGRRMARDVVAWEDGETEVERSLRASAAADVPPAPADEPPRAWRALSGPGAGSADAARLERYAQHDFDVLRKAIEQFERSNDASRVEMLSRQAAARFRGSPARDAFLLARAEARRDLPALAALWTERIEDEPGDWGHYVRLALTHLRARDAGQAQQVLLAIPGLASDKPVNAILPAEVAGELLLRAGEPDLSRPLLLIAAQPGAQVSGGVPQLHARALLAQLEGDWNGMRELLVLLHEQHQDDRGLTQAAIVSFLQRQPEEGWRAFYEASKRFEHAGPWEAARIGHRIEATRPDDVVAFAKRWKSLSGSAAVETRLRGRFLFAMLMVDRPATDWALEELVDFGEERKDAGLAAHAQAYAAFKRGRYEEVVQGLSPLHEAGEADSAALPWLALALAQSGRLPEARALLDGAPKASAGSFHTVLAEAYVRGSAGAAEQALDALWDAFLGMPRWSPAAAPLVPAGYQILEACERLHTLTGDARYRELLVDLARRLQRARPESWAYAFEARHAATPGERDQALTMALFLDPESEHLRDFAPGQRQRAADRIAAGSPFRRG